MAGLILPYARSSQPDYVAAPAPDYADAVILAPFTHGMGLDWSANANHLALSYTNFPAYAARDHGQTLRFDGSTTRLQSTNQVTPGAAFTVFAWVRPSATNNFYARIAETEYASGFYLGSNTGTQYAFIVNNATLEGCIGGQQVVGQRDFVLGVFDGTNRILYVNGVQVASSAATAPSAARTVYVGAYGFAGSSNFWSGDIDTFGLFNRAFTPAEIFALNQNPWQLFEPEPRRIWVDVPAATGDSVGSASGTSTVSGVGASDNAQPGTSAGTSTASGVGASTAESVGSSSGLASVSGTGAADANSAGSSSGVATVSGVGTSSTGSSGSAAGTSTASGVGSSVAESVGSGSGVGTVSGVGSSIAESSGASSGSASVSAVGDYSVAGSSVGSASGTSTVSGVGASVVSAVGTASGSSVVSGVGASTGGEVESFSGGYEVYYSREERAKIRKKQREKLGIVEEEKGDPAPALNKFEISNLARKKPVLVPAAKVDHEALNVELKRLVALEVDREEQEILRLLMEL